MVSRMKLTSALLFGSLFALGCSSEASGPTVTSDSSATGDEGTDTQPVVEDDTAKPAEDAPTTGSATFADVYSKVLTGSCAGGYCHGGTAGGWTVKSDAASTYTQLVDKTSSACSGLKKVEPGQPEKSSLYLKLRGSFMGVCTGNKMPTGGSVTATQLEMVRSWIAGGAKP